MNKIKWLFPFVLLLLVGCEACDREKALSCVADIQYVKDHATGLCYAHCQRGYQAALAHVPCGLVKDRLVNRF